MTDSPSAVSSYQNAIHFLQTFEFGHMPIKVNGDPNLTFIKLILVIETLSSKSALN